MSYLEVIRAAPSTTVQDLGRPGLAHLGVPSSGALDPDALRLANRLVGNPPGAAGLELVLGGLVFEARRSVRIAVTGAHMPVTVDGRARPWSSAVSVARGSVVEVGVAEAGLRAWLAVDGGVDVPAVLGSRSSDLLTGLGPAPVVAGDLLALGRARRKVAPDAVVHASWTLPEVATLPLRLGPRDDWFTADAVASLFGREHRVGHESDRVGLRLESADGSRLVRRVTAELPSEGIVTGAVQVPPSGSPLVFLADHPVTGGYPVVGVVAREALGVCAQLRPGDLVRFTRA